MPAPAAAVGVGIGLQAASTLAGIRSKRKAQKRRRALIRQALAQLTPQQFNAIAAELLPDIGGVGGGLAESSGGDIGSRASTLGLSPTTAQAGLSNQARLNAAQQAFEQSMGMGGLNAQRYLSQAGAVQPNTNLADLLGTGSGLFNTYVGYKGLRGA